MACASIAFAQREYAFDIFKPSKWPGSQPRANRDFSSFFILFVISIRLALSIFYCVLLLTIMARFNMFEFYMFCELFFVRMVSKVCIPKGFDIFQDPEYRIVCGWAKIFHETTLNSTKQDKLVCFMLFSKYVRWDWEKVAVAKKYIFLYNIHHMPSSDENMELSYQALNEGMCLLHYNAMKRFVGAMAVALLAVVAYLHI